MKNVYRLSFGDWGLMFSAFFLIIFSTLVLRSLAPNLFPNYYIYIGLAVIVFWTSSKIDFEIYEAFSGYLYVISIMFLVTNLVLGQVTRDVVRWISVGIFNIQVSEAVRPFLILFFAVLLTKKKVDLKHFFKALFLFVLPALMILIQPSLGVAVLLGVGFAGVIFSLDFDKKILAVAVLSGLLLTPFSWFFLADYQKDRVLSVINPTSDPYGSGYNSIQSKIAVGSGQIWGRGLGEGVQTQLQFLPEKHTDFIFAGISEEMGFAGAAMVIIGSYFVLWKLVNIMSNTKSIAGRSFVSGVFLTLFIQILVHVGMNMGMFPITGIPLPLVSAGGSSLITTMLMLGMVISAKKTL